MSAELFEATKRWGRWGEDDDRGALNLLTPAHVAKAASLVRDGVTVPCGRPLATAPAIDNPIPALHHTIHAGDFAATAKGFQWSADFVGVACHGNAVSHIDALCHVFVDGRMYNGAPASDVTSVGARRSSIEVADEGIAGRGVLLDIPRLRGVDWLDPGDAITAESSTPPASRSSKATSSSSTLAVTAGATPSGRGTPTPTVSRGSTPNARDGCTTRTLRCSAATGCATSCLAPIPTGRFPSTCARSWEWAST